MQTRKNKEFSDVSILSGEKPFSLFLSQLFSELENEEKRAREILIDLALFAISAIFLTIFFMHERKPRTLVIFSKV